MKQHAPHRLIVAVVGDQQLARLGVEHLGRLVAAAGGELACRRRSRRRKHPVAVAGDRELLAAAGDVEHAHDAVGRGGGQAVARGTERAVEHDVARHAEHFHQLAAVGFEQPHFAVLAGSAAGDGQKLAIRAVSGWHRSAGRCSGCGG